MEVHFIMSKFTRNQKIEIIDKVIVDNQSVMGTTIEYGLLSDGLLFNLKKQIRNNMKICHLKKR